MNNLVFYLLLLITFFAYFVFVLTGTMPIIAYLYALTASSIINYLVNIDRILINAGSVLLFLTPLLIKLPGKTKDESNKPNFFKYIFSYNMRQNQVLLKVLNSAISVSILYIVFKTLTTTVFYIINSIMLRPSCRSLAISFRASNPIVMVYMFFFVFLAIPEYITDISNFFNNKIVGSNSTMGLIIGGIISIFHGISTFILKILVTLSGSTMTMILGKLEIFVIILGKLAEQYEGEKGSEKIKILIKGLNKNANEANKKKSNANFSLELKKIQNQMFKNKKGGGSESCCDDYERKKVVEEIEYVFGINIDKNKTDMAFEELRKIWKEKGFKYQLLIAFFTILEQYATLSEILGGSPGIINIITRGLYAGIVVILPILVVTIVVIFFPSLFGGEKE